MTVLLDKAGLAARGITYSDVHLWRLMKANKFPKAVKSGPGHGTRNTWVESEIDEWIEARIAERDVEAA